MKAFLLLVLLVGLCGCSGGTMVSTSSASGGTTPTPALFQVSWEFVATPTSGKDDTVRLIEANLQQSGSAVSSSALQYDYYVAAWIPPVQGCGTECALSLSGTVSGSSLAFTLAMTECYSSPCSFQGTATLQNGKLSGTWSLTDGTDVESGTLIGTPTTIPTADFTGTLITCVTPVSQSCSTQGSDTAAISFTANSAMIQLTGTNNGTFTENLSQPIFVGNTFSFPSPTNSSEDWLGYYDATGSFTGKPDSIEVIDGTVGANEGVFMGYLQSN